MNELRNQTRNAQKSEKLEGEYTLLVFLCIFQGCHVHKLFSFSCINHLYFNLQKENMISKRNVAPRKNLLI
jgi:hypothetical protein